MADTRETKTQEEASQGKEESKEKKDITQKNRYDSFARETKTQEEAYQGKEESEEEKEEVKVSDVSKNGTV